MTDRLRKMERYYGMEMNVEETKVMRISRQTFPLQIMTDQNNWGNSTHFKHLGKIKNDARSTREIKFWTAMAKEAVNKKTLFISIMDLNLRKKLAMCYI